MKEEKEEKKDELKKETMKPEEIPGPKPHSHPFDEIFTFFGTDFNNPEDLCAEIEFYLEEEPVKLTKSCIGFIPAGMRHCPVNMNRLDRPFFHFSNDMITRWILKCIPESIRLNCAYLLSQFGDWKLFFQRLYFKPFVCNYLLKDVSHVDTSRTISHPRPLPFFISALRNNKKNTKVENR